MKIYITTEEEYEIDRFRIDSLFLILHRNNDTLIYDEKNKTESDLEINIYSTNPKHTNFTIKNSTNLNNDLENLIIKILGYKKILLKNICVQDKHKNISSHLIEIFIDQQPFLDVEDELFLDKRSTVKLDENNEYEFINNVHQNFKTNSPILLPLLSSRILGFKNQKEYKISNTKAGLKIYTKNSTNFLAAKLFNLDGYKKFYNFLLFKRNETEENKTIGDAFLNEYSAELDEQFYTVITKIQDENLKLDFLKNIVNLAPILGFNNHKQKYLKCIMGMFSGRRKRIRGIKKQFEFLNIKEEQSAERFFNGSLKHYFYFNKN